jgi:hypothetical protein
VIDGHLSRIVVLVGSGKPAAFKEVTREAPSDEVVRAVQDLVAPLKADSLKSLTTAPPMRRITFDPDARRVMVAFRDRMEELRGADEQTAPIYARGFENALRVAGVVAVGAGDEVVNAEEAAWATAFVGWCIEGLIHLIREDIGDSEHERSLKKILAWVRGVLRNPKGKYALVNRRGYVAHKQLMHAFWRIDKRDRDNLIKTLVEDVGLLASSEEDGARLYCLME